MITRNCPSVRASRRVINLGEGCVFPFASLPPLVYTGMNELLEPRDAGPPVTSHLGRRKVRCWLAGWLVGAEMLGKNEAMLCRETCMVMRR